MREPPLQRICRSFVRSAKPTPNAHYFILDRHVVPGTLVDLRNLICLGEKAGSLSLGCGFPAVASFISDARAL